MQRSSNPGFPRGGHARIQILNRNRAAGAHHNFHSMSRYCDCFRPGFSIFSSGRLAASYACHAARARLARRREAGSGAGVGWGAQVVGAQAVGARVRRRVGCELGPRGRGLSHTLSWARPAPPGSAPGGPAATAARGHHRCRRSASRCRPLPPPLQLQAPSPQPPPHTLTSRGGGPARPRSWIEW
jgi:hypothetical protein